MAVSDNLIFKVKVDGQTYSIAPSAYFTASLKDTNNSTNNLWVLEPSLTAWTGGMVIAVRFTESKQPSSGTNFLFHSTDSTIDSDNYRIEPSSTINWKKDDVLLLLCEPTTYSMYWRVAGSANSLKLSPGRNIALTETTDADGATSTEIAVTDFATDSHVDELFNTLGADVNLYSISEELAKILGTTENSNVMPTIRFIGANQSYYEGDEECVYPNNPLKFTVQIVSGYVFPGDIVQLCKKTLKTITWNSTKTQRYRSRAYFNFVCQQAYGPGSYITFTYTPGTRDELIRSTTGGKTSTNTQYIRIARYYDTNGNKQYDSYDAAKGVFSNEASFRVKYYDTNKTIRIH